MELAEVVNTQYALPVGIVLICAVCAVLVFAFGFKSSSPPKFNQLAHVVDDRKTAGKKRKLKDKKTVLNNLSSSSGAEEGRKQKVENSSKVSVGKVSKQNKATKDETEKTQLASKQQPVKKKNVSQKENVNELALTNGKSKNKNVKQTPESKKVQPAKDSSVQIDSKVKSQEKRLLKEKNYNIQQVKNTKNNSSDGKQKHSKNSKAKINEEKPVDFDDGEWEQAVSRKEKKSKKKDEESLLAANAKNSGASSAHVNPSTASSTQPSNDSINLSASANSGGANNLIPLCDTSKDPSTNDAAPSVGICCTTAISSDVLAMDVLNGENVKKVTATKASDSIAPAATNEKTKSSKSKGKNKDSTISSVQKNNASQEIGNVSVANTQHSADETIKSKKKKKQSNAAENKDGKSPVQSVESSKQQTVAVETAGGNDEQDIHDNSSAKVELASAVVFDELGDIWKEAKTMKKSKKKVRKDQ